MSSLGLKISCFLVAVLIWIQVASTADIEQTTELDLRMTGLGDGLTVAGSDLLPKIRVRVTGSKLRLLTHQYFNHYIGEVRFNLTGLADTTFSYQLDRDDIFTEGLKDADIIRPRILTVTVDREVSRRLAVDLAADGSLPSGLDFVMAPRIRPDSVVVTGPARFFSEDLVLSTEAVELDRISGATRMTVDLVAPGEFLELGIAEVEVGLLVGQLVDRTLANIPVIPLVDAGRPDVGISPPVADVMVRGVADSVRALTRDRISVVVPVDNLAEGVFVLAGQVVHPDWLTLIRLEPGQFQVIVGNPPIRTNGLAPGNDGEGPRE